jgi:hypothetical protein
VTGLDPAKLREAGRAALAELDAAHQVISELQGIADDKWREVSGIENRLKAIFVALGFAAAGQPFDENAAGDPAAQLDLAADILDRLTAAGPDGQAARDAAALLRDQARQIRDTAARGAEDRAGR